MLNYTLADTLRILYGFLLLSLFTVFPGYLAGVLSDALGFRSRPVAQKLVMALPFSLATSPLLIYLTGRAGGLNAAWIAIAICAICFLIFFPRDYRRQVRAFAGCGKPACLAFCYMALAIAILVDIQYNGRLYISTPTWDYTIRNGLISTITRTGVTPVNPFFFPGQAIPLRYHYFLFLPCSMVETLSGGWITPGTALAAATLWCGLALMCLVYLYNLHFRSSESSPSPRSLWVATLLIPVMGLDLLPNLLLLSRGLVNFTIDKWNEDLIGWFDSTLWAPHYVAAAIACLTGFLILWTGAKPNAKPTPGPKVLAGAAFACAAGMGIYVVFVFAAALACYGVIALWKGWKEDVRGIVIAGVSGALLALPYLLSLARSGGANTGPALIVPSIRSFKMAELVLQAMGQSRLTISLVNLLLLPSNYALELGVLFIAGIVQARRYRRRKRSLGRKEWALIALTATPLLICSFFRSGVIANNDLGWRGVLIAQFTLLLMAVSPIRACLRPLSNKLDRKHWAGYLKLRPRMIAGLWIGVAGIVAGAVIERGFMAAVEHNLLPNRNWVIPDNQVSRRMLSLRETYEWIDQHTPATARIQPSPAFLDFGYGLYARRAAIAADEVCGAPFGGSAAVCDQLLKAILPAFQAGTPDVQSLCRQFPIAMVIAKDLDPVWNDRKSWVWQNTPVHANAFSRVFACPAP